MKGRAAARPAATSTGAAAAVDCADRAAARRHRAIACANSGPEDFAAMDARRRSACCVTDTTLRDAHQSLFATRMRTADMLAIAPLLRAALPQLFSLEMLGRRHLRRRDALPARRIPWERLRQLRERMPEHPVPDAPARRPTPSATPTIPTTWCRHFVKQAAAERHRPVPRLRLAQLGDQHARRDRGGARDPARSAKARSATPATSSIRRAPKYDLKYYVKLAKELEQAGAHMLGIKDMAGVCRPHAARALVKALKEEIGLPIHFHTHDTSGISGGASCWRRSKPACDVVDARHRRDERAAPRSPTSTRIAAALQAHDARSRARCRQALHEVSRLLGRRAPRSTRRSNPTSAPAPPTSTATRCPAASTPTCASRRGRWAWSTAGRRSSRTYADVNRLFGDIVKVTPTSKVVGDMALLMVANDLTPTTCSIRQREIAFPESVVSLLQGRAGLPAGRLPGRAVAQES